MSLLWKIGGIVLACAAAYFLVTMYGGAKYKQGRADSDTVWSEKVIEAEKAKLIAYQNGIASVQKQEVVYHNTVEKLVPITKTIVERAAEYAQTPDGASMCLSSERVQLLDQTRSALFPSATPASTNGRKLPLLTNSEGQSR